jgi:hypothetical protein
MYSSKELKPSTRYFLGLLALWGLLAGTVLPDTKGRHYPHIKRAGLVMKVDRSQPIYSKEVIIRDVSGRPAYRLSVYVVSLDKQTASSIHVELNGIGSGATQSDAQYEADLLNPDRWGHGAGQRVFLPEQLCPANRKDSAWGARRAFTLRRMRIEVTISDIELNESFNGITRAHITVHVTPSTSTNSRSADVPYNEPKPCK